MTTLHPLYDKKFTCAICHTSFTSKKVRSRFVKVKEYESDFRPIYESTVANPILYHVQVCPNCGYSFTEEFSSYFVPGTKEEIMQKVCNKWVPRDYGSERSPNQTITTLKLASYCGTLKKEKHIHIAGIYIRIAWIYRDLHKQNEETRFLKLALHEYMESYLSDDFQGTQVSAVRVLYLLGELSHRLGNTDDAIRHFSKVIEQQKRTTETKIVEMARERWYEIRNKEQVTRI